MTRDRFAAGVLLAAWTLVVVGGIVGALLEHAPITLVASGVGTIALLVRKWS